MKRYAIVMSALFLAAGGARAADTGELPANQTAAGGTAEVSSHIARPVDPVASGLNAPTVPSDTPLGSNVTPAQNANVAPLSDQLRNRSVAQRPDPSGVPPAAPVATNGHPSGDAGQAN